MFPILGSFHGLSLIPLLAGQQGENMFDIVLMNMAIMDVSTLEPLVQALPKLLKPNGVYVDLISGD